MFTRKIVFTHLRVTGADLGKGGAWGVHGPPQTWTFFRASAGLRPWL